MVKSTQPKSQQPNQPVKFCTRCKHSCICSANACALVKRIEPTQIIPGQTVPQQFSKFGATVKPLASDNQGDFKLHRSLAAS